MFNSRNVPNSSCLHKSKSSWVAIENTNGGFARDVVVVSPSFPSTKNKISCCDFFVQIPSKFYNSSMKSSPVTMVSVEVNDQKLESMTMYVEKGGKCKFVNACKESPYRPSTSVLEQLLHQKRSDKFHSETDNRIRYIIPSKNFVIQSQIYFWSSCDSIIVCDIDGTITKSNIKGFLDFSHVHRGVCRFFSEVFNTFKSIISSKSSESRSSNYPGYEFAEIRIIYLTARPMTLHKITRKFLSGLSQSTKRGDTESKFSLPAGPIFVQEGNIQDSIYSELFEKNVHDLKHQMLESQVMNPFVKAGRPMGSNLFTAGFGNAVSDVKAYLRAGMCHDEIYIVNKSSEIICLDQVCGSPIELISSDKRKEVNVPASTLPNDDCLGSMKATSAQLMFGTLDSISDICHVSLTDSSSVFAETSHFKSMSVDKKDKVSISMLYENISTNSVYNSYEDPRLAQNLEKKIRKKAHNRKAIDDEC